MSQPLRSRNLHPADWQFRRVAARRGTAPADVLRGLDPARLREVEAFEVRPALRVRRGAAAPARVEFDLPATLAPAVVAVRHASGAITFHAALAARATPAATRTRARLRFSIAVPAAPAASGTPPSRHAGGALLRIVVLRAIEPLATRAIARLARTWEARTWQAQHLAEGWVRVLGQDDASFAVEPVSPTAAELGAGPCLLLLHGTFSDSVGSFRGLAQNGFLAAARTRYGERIFAFEHFSVSRTPAENAAMLRAGLPAGTHAFDLIAYSRGGVVARLLDDHGADPRLQPGRVLLVEAALRGTPLAHARRYDQLLGWVANLAELFPTSAPATALAWLTDGLVWLAHRLTGALPGIAALDPDGAALAPLLAATRADARYAAIGAEFDPPAGVRARLLDAAASGFFAMPNDLVVPSAGCYTFGHAEASAIAPAQRLLFDRKTPGDDGPGRVHHLNAMAQTRTARFAEAWLLASARQPRRGLFGKREKPALTLSGAIPAADGAIAPLVPQVAADPNFHVIVLSNDEAKARPSRILATWGGAKVQERFAWSERDEPGAGQRWNRIIAMHARLLAYFSGEPGATLPDDAALCEFGRLLFEALMVGQVGRLYDEARGKAGALPLTVTLSAESGRWAEKPWEFAFDPARRTWLATEDVHLIRDVLGAVPADALAAHAPPLRLLVAHAQPIDATALSVADEARLIRRAFQGLVDAGLAVVDVLPRATPAALQEQLEAHAYDVLHFVGHGSFDNAAQEGLLLFEDGARGTQRLPASRFRQIVARRGLRMVFLNACETGRGGVADFTRGVAPALLAAGVPAVVANQFSVFDSAAVSFAQNLYARLAAARPLAEAMREARIALNHALDGTNIDWAIPVLFTRVPTLRLCTPMATRTARGRADTPAVAARSGRRRIGVWDMDRRWPALEETLAALNATQSQLTFVAHDASVPLAAAVLPGRRSKGAAPRRLDADAVRQRLRRVPAELGLDALVGVTDASMVDAQRRALAVACGRDAAGQPNTVALAACAPVAGGDAQRVTALLAGVIGALGPADAPAPTPDAVAFVAGLRQSPALRRRTATRATLSAATLDALLATPAATLPAAPVRARRRAPR